GDVITAFTDRVAAISNHIQAIFRSTTEDVATPLIQPELSPSPPPPPQYGKPKMGKMKTSAPIPTQTPNATVNLEKKDWIMPSQR
ncbi:hypothetical protein ACJMK2_011328, partial [Sinanodonta woodiana]